MKICTKCKVKKELSEYNKSKKAKDGHKSSCRMCDNKAKREYNAKNKQKAHQYYLDTLDKRREYKEKNKEYIKQQKKDYRRRNKEAIKKYEKEYREKNKEIIRIRQKEWRSNNCEYFKIHNEENKDRKKKLNKIWKKENKDKVNHYTNLRRARKKKLTPKDADLELIAKYYKKCKEISIKTNIEYNVDHIIPLAKGGLHHQDNLQIIPAEINQKKSDKLDYIVDPKLIIPLD